MRSRSSKWPNKFNERFFISNYMLKIVDLVSNSLMHCQYSVKIGAPEMNNKIRYLPKLYFHFLMSALNCFESCQQQTDVFWQIGVFFDKFYAKKPKVSDRTSKISSWIITLLVPWQLVVFFLLLKMHGWRITPKKITTI